MQINPDIFSFVYLIATIFFILGLKGLSSPKSALRGNTFAMMGMLMAAVTTILHPEVEQYEWILAGILLGAFIGIPLAKKIQMTAMPQLVAALHSFVGLSAVCVAIGTFLSDQMEFNLNSVLLVEIALGSAIGAVTFTGSVVAFGKLQGIFGSNPFIFRGRHLVNIFLISAIIVLTIFSIQTFSLYYLLALTLLAFILGVLIVTPIGGADMPVVVSMLNSYSGWAASATGFTLGNNLLIATGALVGSSGAILSYIMCKAMNRSFISVILGGFGGEEGFAKSSEGKQVKSSAAEDAAFMMENASKVIIIPGYGMAVAQAQHALKELYQVLEEKNVTVRFAIHPVAGRMPGHMNVLLAEADIPYEIVVEMEEINPEFNSTDVAFIVGANDIVNPAAKTDKTSPLYGMPILESHRASQVFVSKRSMRSGYSGVDNELFYYDNCSLIFGDAKATCEALVNALR